MAKSYILYNNITRYKPQNRMIPAEATFNRVWEQMELLKSKSSVQMFLEKSINENFISLDLQSIQNERKKFNIKKGMPKRFISMKEIETAANNTVISINQAHEYFSSANRASPMTKPLLLYYGMVSFAKALISSTYIIDENNKAMGHGLLVSHNDNFVVTIKKTGEYQNFRDCYMADTSIYTRNNSLKFNLKDLLSVVPGMRMEWMLAYEKEFDERYYDLHNMPPEYSKYFKIPSYAPLKVTLETSEDDYIVIYDMGDAGEIHDPKWVIDFGNHGSNMGMGGKEFVYTNKFVHIIDIYYLAMFILCFYARYRPSEWDNYLKEDNNLFLIQAFLRRAELDFPMLMYSEITRIKTYFKIFG